MKNIVRQTLVFSLLVVLLFSCTGRQQQLVGDRLPRSTPEAEGIDSKGIIDFLKAADTSRHEFHSFMLLRHGKVVAEGWWNPYSPELKHTLYSTSKSFTSTAIGFAVSENRLKVTDKVISFFPEYLPDTLSENLKKMEVRDLLTMSAGQDPDPTSVIPTNDTNWVKAFLARRVINEPGTKFLYNSMATYMLSAIVQKVTGEKVIDYLTPRLFSPLAIKGMDWETDPMGINTGGWGLRLRTEDMAKFGQLYLQEGKWNGKQLIPEKWVKEATTFKIDQFPGAPDSVRRKSDWVQGYCYQFWRCRNNAFRGDGAFGQFIIVMPEKDAVMAITCETPDMQKEINLFWNFIFPAIKDSRIAENPASDATLLQMLGSLSVKLPAEGVETKTQDAISGKTYLLDRNDGNFESLEIDFDGDVCNVSLAVNGTNNSFSFGKESWIKGLTSLPGPNLLMRAKHHFVGLPPTVVTGIYRWREKDQLELTLRYIESPHTETVTCTFDGDKVSVGRKMSFMPNYKIAEITGHWQK